MVETVTDNFWAPVNSLPLAPALTIEVSFDGFAKCVAFVVSKVVPGSASALKPQT